jgi:transcriptional regulator with XRE-family HTH domain
MLIGLKLKEIRESKNLSQGDIEERIGLLRCYTSRVENGHTVPLLKRWRNTPDLEVPLYELFYDGKGRQRNLISQQPSMTGQIIVNCVCSPRRCPE